FPDYIPNSMKAEANVAIQDLLGQTFSYPGATAGLPSKGKVLRTVAGGLIPGSNTDFTQTDVTGQLSQQQQHERQVIQSASPLSANGTPVTSWDGPSIPTQVILTHSLPTQATKETVLSNALKASSPKKKESQFVPRSIQVR